MLLNYVENALSVEASAGGFPGRITLHNITWYKSKFRRHQPDASEISAVFFVFCVITGARYGRARNNYRLNRTGVAANIHTCKGFGRRLKKTSLHHSLPVYLPVPQRTGAPLSHPPSALVNDTSLLWLIRGLRLLPRGTSLLFRINQYVKAN